MKYIKEKVAYLQGLVDGLGIAENTDEGKVLVKMLEILGDITDALDGLAEAQSETEEYIEMIDDDLTDLEEFILDEDLLDDDEDDDEDLYEVICPACGESYFTDFESFDADEVICPFCNEKFILEEEVLDQLTEHDSEEE